MYTANLPFFSEQTPLDEILKQMKATDQAAAIIQYGNGPNLVTIDEVVKKIRECGEDQLASCLERSNGPLFLPPGFSSTKGFIEARSTSSIPENIDSSLPDIPVGMASALASSEGTYAVVHAFQGRAEVITADSYLADSFYTKVILCRCTDKPEAHVWLPGELQKPGICNLDGCQVNCE
jgi:hypothetical protein